jgi:hypothetical protein
MSADGVATIWRRIDLGDSTVAKLTPRGMVKLEQITGGELVTIWLAPDQVRALIHDYLHQAALTRGTLIHPTDPYLYPQILKHDDMRRIWAKKAVFPRATARRFGQTTRKSAPSWSYIGDLSSLN